MIETATPSHQTALQRGALYVIATPIGNLSDITLRALNILTAVDEIYAEDTRVSQRLLNAHGIRKPLFSLREHNEAAMADKIITKLQQGLSVAQLSDAGTPAICDPGARLVRKIRAQGLPIIPIPGASAVTTALSAAGLDQADFYFAGFVPASKNDKIAFLKQCLSYPFASVMYEAPHRLVDTLKVVAELAPQHPIFVARELTKSYESFYSNTAATIYQHFLDHPDQVRGEMVLMLERGETSPKNKHLNAKAQQLLDLLATHLSTSVAAKIVAEATNASKNACYDYLIAKKNQHDDRY